MGERIIKQTLKYQNIEKVRAEKGLEEMEKFYSYLNDVPPVNIPNYDKTNLYDNPRTSKCVFEGELNILKGY